MSKCYVFLKGGICNQLFQVAMGYAYAKEHNKELILDPTHWLPEGTNRFHPAFYIDKLYKNFSIGVTPKSVQVVYEQQRNYAKLPFYEGDVAFHGCWQTHKYFEKYSSEIIQKLGLSKSPEYTPDYDIAMHIRRGDYLDHNWNFLHVCKTNYFRYFFEKYKDKKIKVFTDSPGLVMEEFEECNFEIANNQLDLDDLIEMVHSKVLVGSNSTFSWWASFAGKQECYFPDVWISNWSLHTYDDIYRDDMNLHPADL